MSAAAVLAVSLARHETDAIILALRLAKALVLVAVTIILFRRRQRDPVAALLSLAFLTWAITSSFDFAGGAALPLLLDRLRFLLFALALLLFPDGDWQPAWTRTVALASGAVFLIGGAEAVDLLPTRWFLPLAIPCVLAAIASLIARFRSARSEALRQQLKWVALGLVAGVGLILLARAGASSAAEMTIVWEALFQGGIVIIALGFLVSLLRYRLFDAERAISRSATLAVLTLVLVATFAGTESAIETVGQQYLGMGIGNVSAAMAAAVAAVLLNPLHNRISDWAEGYFQADLVSLKRELPELLEDLAGALTPREVGEAVLSRICTATHATRAGLLLDGEPIALFGLDRRTAMRSVGAAHDGADGLGASGTAKLAMSCPSGRCSGWLLLGPRPDGTPCGKDEIDAVKQILPAVRRSVIAAMSRDALRAESRRTIARVERQIQELTGRVAAIGVG